MRRHARALVLLLTLASTTGACFRGGPELAMGALQIAAVVAEVALVAAILDHHDDHFHGGECHPIRYYDGRALYYYNGRWESYDEPSGNWYVYY